MKALLVPKEKTETVRRKLLESGYLDLDRKLVFQGDFSEIPIFEGIASPDDFKSFPVIEQQNVDYYEHTPGLKEILRGHLDESKMDLLPGGWQILGDIIIVSLNMDLYYARTKIGSALLKMYPYCRSVYLDRGIHGDLRLPSRELISAKNGVIYPGETVHKENGCRFRLDVTKVMFSKGNLKERIRMSRLGCGEVVVDMFAGIGYFSIPMAVHSRPVKILAIELNPESFHYLKENIGLNQVECIVEPILGDCAALTPVAAANRVIMGYVGNTHRYLKYGITALKKSGILHYHESVPARLAPDRPIRRIRAAGAALGRNVEILNWYRVKKYSPGVWHVVIDAAII